MRETKAPEEAECTTGAARQARCQRKAGEKQAKKSPLTGSGLNPYQEETWRRQLKFRPI